MKILDALRINVSFILCSVELGLVCWFFESVILLQVLTPSKSISKEQYKALVKKKIGMGPSTNIVVSRYCKISILDILINLANCHDTKHLLFQY